MRAVLGVVAAFMWGLTITAILHHTDRGATPAAWIIGICALLFTVLAVKPQRRN